MKFPFVSRERFDEERARALKAEKELEEMRAKFLAFLESEPTPAIGDGTDLGKIQPIAGRPTIANVIAYANTEAFRRAQTPGARGVSEDLALARAKLTTIKKAANGG
jgi:hypothetical protein